MEFIFDITAARERIEKSINAFGYAPEHKYEHYVMSLEDDEKGTFVVWDDATALLTHEKNGEWFVFSEPIAPQALAASRMIEFVQKAFEDSAIKKIWFELQTKTRKDFLRTLPNTFRANPINYTLIWPVMNMNSFDPALPGGHWKSMRNARNKLYREHAVEIREASQVSKNELHDIIDTWVKARKAGDRAYPHMYHHMIDHSFPGVTSARAMIVDGTARGINAGWATQKAGEYYGAVGIHDYSIPDLGQMLFLEDMTWIKNAGFETADMAGGEKKLTYYKNQFLPEFSYKTFVFSVVRS